MDLLKEADMLWCQSSSMPIEQNHDLKELADQVPTEHKQKDCTDTVFVLSGSPRIEDQPGCMFCSRFAGISGEFPACLSVSEIGHQLASS